jgi:hypothetical protein
MQRSRIFLPMSAVDSLGLQELPDYLDIEGRLGLLPHLSDIRLLTALRG